MENAVLKATGLVKNYGGTRALDGLELELPQGKIVGLLGPIKDIFTDRLQWNINNSGTYTNNVEIIHIIIPLCTALCGS